MPFALIRDIAQSLRVLRIRLAAWYGGAFALLIVTVLMLVHEGLRYDLVQETDNRLTEDAKETAQAITQLYPDAEAVKKVLARKADNHTHERLFLQWLDSDGATLWASRETPHDISQLELSDQGVFPAGEDSLFRVAQRRVDHPGMPAYIVRVGASQEQINAAVQRRTRLLMLSGAIVLTIAVGGAYWISGAAIHPLSEMTRIAERLRPSHLDERLKIRNTGDELDRLSRTINNFLDRIGDYLRKNREFVANAAHELRSPLAAIRSSVDVALSADRSNEEYHSLLVVIAEECNQLTNLVNQLLVLAESDAGWTVRHTEVLHLEQLVELSGEMFRGVAEEREVALEVGVREAPAVSGDRARLRQVINNLLDNAVKFTPAGGRVRVDVEPSPDRRTVRLRVTDSGCGISAKDLPHVFERFYRGDKGREREGRTRGTGLGLAISRAIIEAHGGTIVVESELDRGTTFEVTLPAHSAIPSNGVDAAHNAPSLK